MGGLHYSIKTETTQSNKSLQAKTPEPPPRSGGRYLNGEAISWIANPLSHYGDTKPITTRPHFGQFSR
jgi:hypothetical protein